jgi:hypothetical protein
MCKLLFHPDERLEPVAIDQPLAAGEILPIAGGIEVIHTPVVQTLEKGRSQGRAFMSLTSNRYDSSQRLRQMEQKSACI